jgi:HK97 family phage major capsid protein
VTIDDLIASVEAGIKAKLDERSKQTKSIEDVRSACLAENRDPKADEQTIVETAQAARAAIDAEVEVMQGKVAEYRAEKARDEAADKLSREIQPGAARPAYDGVVRTGQEPRTYTPEKDARGECSFFVDAYRFQSGDMSARERLERHGQEVKVEREATERATTTSSFAGLIVPQYLVDQAALVARAGRPFANTVQKLQLPEQGTQFQIPRGTTGAGTAIQATENAAVQSTDEVWANVTVNVSTIAGQQDVSRQSLERGTPGIDSLIYLDLAGAYGVNLDTQVLSGSGSSGQMQGVLGTSGVNQATAFGAAATATTFYTKTAGQVNAVETTRFLAPDHIAMHPRRWNWLISQVDSQGRPLAVPFANGPFNAMGVANEPLDTGSAAAVGMFLGLPVVTDASIPTSVGTGPEDQVIVYRSKDLLLWEDGDGMPRELRFEQTLGNQLTVKLVVYGYAAFTAGRYPTAVGIVGGNAGTAGFGLIAPTF